MIRSMLPVAVAARQTAVLVAVLMLPVAQVPTPAQYSAAGLSCAAFREEVRSRIRSQSGSVIREEQAGRDGFLVVRAEPSDSGLSVLAWYDSLAIWREGPEGRSTPDAEGLLGGQWRGTLSSNGDYVGDRAPFIPDEVAEIADLRGVLNDFFPVLPRRALAPGRSEGRDEARRITRAGDASGLERYAWTLKTRADTSSVMADTTVPMRRESEEQGTLLWDPRKGPVSWERTITITARIDAAGPVKRGLRTSVTQQIKVVRLEGGPACR